VDACARPLRRLRLEADSGCAWFDGGGPEWLFQSRHWPHLAWLDVYLQSESVDFGTKKQGWSPIDLSPLLSGGRLTNLNLHCEAIPELLRHPDWGPLRSLQLFTSPSDPVPAGDLAFAPQARQLETLILNTQGGLPEDDAARLGSGPGLANLRRLSVFSCYPGMLPGPYAPNLLRLDVEYWMYDEFWASLTDNTFPRLRWLGLGTVVPAATLAPLLRGDSFPNLCTIVFRDTPLRYSDDEQTELVEALAKAEGVPHLSLVGIGWTYRRQWWVLGGGRAVPVAPGVIPVESDWWENDPVDWWAEI
jgi:hypothetical protein